MAIRVDKTNSENTKDSENAANGMIKEKECSPLRQRLRSWLNKNMRIEMTDGRILYGIFLCTDRDRNVILGSCAEYLQTENDEAVEEPRVLGLAMVPGHHIVSIEVDSDLASNSETVVVQGIGTFGLNQEKLLVSQKPVKYLISQKLVFLMSRSLALKFRINWARKHYEATFPQKNLNLSSIAHRCQLSRYKVLITMGELMTYIERSLYNEKSLSLPIVGVGVLKVHNYHYNLVFNQELLKNVAMQDVLHINDDTCTKKF